MFRLLVPFVVGGLLATTALGAVVDSTVAPLAPAAPLNQITPRPIERGDIMQTMELSGGFKIFVKLVHAAGLADQLKAKGPFTVFAPTDDAFSQFTKAEMDKLLSPEHKAELEQIITYHIVPAEVTSANMSGRQAVASLEGADLVIHATMDSVRVNNANVVMGDIVATNGVIHSIDALLLPPLTADYQGTTN